MATMEQLERAFLKAHQSGDKQNAALFASEIKKRRSASGWWEQGKASLVEGISAIPGMIGDTQQAASQMGTAAADFFGASPETASMVGDITRRVTLPIFQNQLPTTDNIVEALEPVTGQLPSYEDGTTGQQYLRTVGRIAPSALVSPGRTVTKVASGVGAGLLSEGAGQLAEGTPYETAARIGGAVTGGLVGGGTAQAMTQPRAPFRNTPRGSQERVARGLSQEFGGDMNAALARGRQLGPDAMVMNLGARPAGQAITIARQPTQGMTTIKDALKDQRSRATSRVEADWGDAVGPAVSRYGQKLQKAATQAGTDDIYTIARGRPVDPSPVYNTLLKVREAAGNDRVTRAAIDEIAEMLLDPRTGNLSPGSGGMSRTPGSMQMVSDAGGLVNARQAIDTRIRELGVRLTNNPADDVYQLGSRTPTGRQLVALRRAINETLHQDEALRQADGIFAGAERVSEAYEKGRTKTLGTGDNFMEPEALRAWLDNPRVSLSEKEALLRGMSQRGIQTLRDIKPNRNEGAAFGNAVATPNNLARIREAAGPRAADTVESMARREDLFARDNARATANSITSDVQMGAQEFPSPGMNANYANASQVTLPGAVSALAVWAANKATGGMIARERTRIAEGAAKLLTARGEQRGRVVRELMGYAAKLDKQDPARALIMRALLLSRNAPQDNGKTVQ
jgi:hypothetical protein